jgi:hypothetical protein
VAVKQALDALWTVWNPSAGSFEYNNTSLPYDNSAMGSLNGLVAAAYAWYWSKTGDATAMSRGDMAFQHLLDAAGDPSWSGKMDSQMYQWTFDYVRLCNQANAILTVMPSVSTGATITWKAYEPATTQVKYGVTSVTVGLAAKPIDGDYSRSGSDRTAS